MSLVRHFIQVCERRSFGAPHLGHGSPVARDFWYRHELHVAYPFLDRKAEPQLRQARSMVMAISVPEGV